MTVDESWCTSLPGQPRVWDATRIRIAQTCWRKHYLATVRGLRGQGSVHQEFGSLYHGAVEELDKRLLAGEEREAAIVATFRNLLKASWECWFETADGKRFETMGQAEAEDYSVMQGHWVDRPWGGEYVETWKCTSPARVPSPRSRSEDGMVANRNRCPHAKAPSQFMAVIRCHTGGELDCWRCAECNLPALYSREYVPHDSKKNRTSLIRAFLVYADAPESVQLYAFPGEVPAVEIQGRIPLPILSPDWAEGRERLPYELLVNIDSMVLWEGELAIRERKTTQASVFNPRYWDQFNPDPQVDTYDLYASLVYADEDGITPRIMVEAMEVGAGYARLRRVPIRIPAGRREEWFAELQDVILTAQAKAQCVQAGMTPEEAYPRNTAACHAGTGCQFREVCRLAPGLAREEEIAARFRVERWNPIKAESEVEE